MAIHLDPQRTLRFGRTGVQVPAVGVGTWGHSGEQQANGRPTGWSGHDDETAKAALRRAHELGLFHWDTADAYGRGQSERLIGEVLADLPRDEIFLASKVGWVKGSHEHFYHPDQVRSSLEQSLRLTGVERLDLYYLHHCDFGPQDEYLDDALHILQRAREAGKIRFLGLSDWDAKKIVRYLERVDPDVVQPYRNPVDDDYAESGLEALVEERDLGVAFFSPLKHGLLLGRYEEPPELAPGDHRRRIPEFADARYLKRMRELRRRMKDHFPDRPDPMLHALVGTVLADAPTGCALLGLRQTRHAEAAVRVGEALDRATARWVQALFRAV